MSEQLALLPGYLTGHLQLTMLALLVSTLLSVPLGVLATRVHWLEQPALAIAGLIQTIPSLALLAIMVPILAALSLQSIGFLPAIVGLTLYGVLPVLRNTVTGIRGVDPALIEAARGVGMTDMQQLRHVELPLAMPVIVAGIRTATIWIVGIATLSTLVGATSLGNYIFSGLQTRNFTAVLVGSVAAAMLALLLDGLVYSLERGIQTRRRPRVALALGVFIVLYGYTAATLASPWIGRRQRPVVVGAKTFTEQYITSALLAQLVERETGLPTELIQSLGSTVAFDALRTDAIDLYVDYSGTLWTTILKRTDVPSRSEVLEEVGAFLAREHGVSLVGTLGFENAYALAVRSADADRLGLEAISDLVPHAPRMTMGGDYEFFARPEWTALTTAYDLRFDDRRSMESTLMYQAIDQRNVDVISAYSTDGRIAALNLRVLEDDRGAIPPYDAVILASPRLVREHPDVIAALGALIGTVDAATMRQMNLEVDDAGRSPAEVAADFLEVLPRGVPTATGSGRGEN